MSARRKSEKNTEPLPQPVSRRHVARTRRPLFLPRLLREQARNGIFLGSDQDRAHEIIKRWADLDFKGHLDQKEGARDAEFLRDIFGEALGYRLGTDSPDHYDLERELSVPNGSADGALGSFPLAPGGSPVAVIELKAAHVDLDRHRFSGRTPVQQVWDYLYVLPNCPWGIVSNFVTIRLYHRDKTPLAYEEFSLQGMRDVTEFRRFHCLFHRRGLLEGALGRPPLALELLRQTDERQREVGDSLYEEYSLNRANLIAELHENRNQSLDEAIRVAQKILDRIIFIAFCEDRDLLPAQVIQQTFDNVPQLARVTNPRWRNFLDLFVAVDKGHKNLGLEAGYNGGLFRFDPEVDDLQLDDQWTDFFRDISAYDFRDEVNVDVLGHLFERSITELERIRVSGLIGENGDEGDRPGAMKKSAQRKRFGVYYTPPDFTRFIVAQTVGVLAEERLKALAARMGVDPDAPGDDDALVDYWREGARVLRGIRVCDPACGSGAFLIAAYDELETRYVFVADNLEALGAEEDAGRLRDEFPDFILSENLFGVDVSQEAVEITQLALWIRSARRGKTLVDLADNIFCGNSLVADADVHPRAMSWETTFPAVFKGKGGGFDCVIGNPPWERIKLQEREFFAHAAPKIAEAVSAATRRKRIELLEQDNPELYHRYTDAQAQAEKMLNYARSSGRFPLTGKGDINYYVLFAELARSVVAKDGLVGLLVPSGIASDNTTRAFFNALMDGGLLVRLHDFENRKGVFADLHRSFKFCVLVFGGSDRHCDVADFVFFAHRMSDLADDDRHIALSAADMALLNPNTKTCPIFRSRRDAELTKRIYRRVPIFVDQAREHSGNPWNAKFLTMFHQTNDAELFHDPAELKKQRFRRQGNRWTKGKRTFLPLYEAKMVQMYDHRAASVVVDRKNWMRQGQTESTTLVSHQNPEFTAEPRWWVDASAVDDAVGARRADWYLCYKDVTSPTNERTMIASFIPRAGVVNSAPLIVTEDDIDVRTECCLLANLNSVVLDYVARQKVGGVHLNFFVVYQLPILPPDAYTDKCPWNRGQTLQKWISDRVLKLTCTADDMKPLAKAAGFKKEVHKWKAPERVQLQAELDAAYFVLYGIDRADVSYILDTFSGTRRRDVAETGKYRTCELIIEAFDELEAKC